MQGSFLWKSHSLNRHMALPLASFDLTSSANIENASEHASSQSRPQRKSLPIACAGYVFASEKTKPSLRCNRSFPIGPLPDRKSSIHSMCSESSMLHAAPMFDIIPQIHQTRIVANLPRGKKRGCGGNVSAACVFSHKAIAKPSRWSRVRQAEGRRPRHQAEPRSEERRGSFTAISSFVSPSISCGKTIHSFPTSR